MYTLEIAIKTIVLLAKDTNIFFEYGKYTEKVEIQSVQNILYFDQKLIL